MCCQMNHNCCYCNKQTRLSNNERTRSAGIQITVTDCYSITADQIPLIINMHSSYQTYLLQCFLKFNLCKNVKHWINSYQILSNQNALAVERRKLKNKQPKYSSRNFKNIQRRFEPLSWKRFAGLTIWKSRRFHFDGPSKLLHHIIRFIKVAI